MMTSEQFELYRARLPLTDLGQEYLRRVRDGINGQPAAPSRRVESHLGNVIMLYPSGKNGKVLPCESRRIEFAQALLLENDTDVLESYPQPPPIELRYKSAKGRDVRCDVTPDYLVLRRGKIEWVDGKPADKMASLVEARPGRYAAAGENKWQCLPGETTGRAYGFEYRVWTDAEFSRELIRNLRYLDPFLKLGLGHYAESVWRPVLDFLLRRQGISVEELGLQSGIDGPALVRWMLAQRLIYCDLNKHLLVEPARARLYSTREVAKAAEILHVTEPVWPSALGVSTAPASQLTSMTHMTAALLKHGAEAFSEANRRWVVVQSLVPRDQWDVTPRTVRRYKAEFAKAERKYGVGNGYLGLIDKSANKGNSNPRLDQVIVQLADKNIKNHFLSAPAKTGATVYRMFLAECREKYPTLHIPSKVWFYAQLKRLQKGKVVRAQLGERAGYPYKFSTQGVLGLWDSRGDYPFANVHADHQHLDVWVRSAKTGLTLNKPWMTVLFDATARAVLAIFLSLDDPSIDSVMMVLRECVFRHQRLPLGLTVDNGREFMSTWFEVFAASKGIIVTRRPPHEAKYGSPIENFFGVQDEQFIHVLEGSNQILQTPRLSTKTVDPRRRAIWTLAELHKAIECYCFEHFNQRVHADLGQSPADALKALMAKHGIDRLPETKFDDDFLLLTMLEVADGTARVQRPCGVKVRGDYFHNPQLAGFIGRDLPARWDPMDPGRVLVELPEGWVPCISRYAKEVAGLSVRDVQFLAQELRQRHPATARTRPDADAKLGAYLRQVKEVQEPELRRRIERAAENREVASHLVHSSPPGDTRDPANSVGISGDKDQPPIAEQQTSTPAERQFNIPTALPIARKKAPNLL